MRKSDAKNIAAIISDEQIAEMLSAAKNGINDWTKPSRINMGISKGAAWNILTNNKASVVVSQLVKIRLIQEFGEFLPPSLKPPKRQINKSTIVHQDPKF